MVFTYTPFFVIIEKTKEGKFMKKITKVLLSILLVCGLVLPLADTLIVDAAVVKISQSSLTLDRKKSKVLKVVGTKNKVYWKSNNPKVATVNKSGKVTAIKKGKTTITATVNKKKYKCNVSVNPISGDREKPLSAYEPVSLKYYQYGSYIGKFQIQLLEYMDGDEAENYLKNNFNPELRSDEQFVYFKFKVKYLEGEDEVKASDIINDFSNFYNSSSTKQINSNDWAFIDDGVESMINISLYPGGEAVGYFTLITKKGDTPLTYRIETGYDKNSYETAYTWFTTKK